MSQCRHGFHFPTTAELEACAVQRDADRGWALPYLEARNAKRARQPPWPEAEEALSRSAFVDPISVMITFLRIED
jgi:hypothetical protein